MNAFKKLIALLLLALFSAQVSATITQTGTGTATGTTLPPDPYIESEDPASQRKVAAKLFGDPSINDCPDDISATCHAHFNYNIWKMPSCWVDSGSNHIGHYQNNTNGWDPIGWKQPGFTCVADPNSLGHTGIDIAYKNNEPNRQFYAISSGVLIMAGVKPDGNDSTENTIAIYDADPSYPDDTTKGVTTLYLHALKTVPAFPALIVGQRIEVGTPLGKQGHTSSGTIPDHVHFGVRPGKRYNDLNTPYGNDSIPPVATALRYLATTATTTGTAADTTFPQVAISSPGASGTTVNVSSSSLAISGTASDNVGVTQVTWANDRGGSGTASGTTNWSVTGIALQSGYNTITVRAYDAAGNVNLANIIVNYTVTNTTLPPIAGSGAISGNWKSNTASTSNITDIMSFTLNQSGSTITGTGTLRMSSVYCGPLDQSLAVTGSVSGQQVTLNITSTSDQQTCNGTGGWDGSWIKTAAKGNSDTITSNVSDNVMTSNICAFSDATSNVCQAYYTSFSRVSTLCAYALSPSGQSVSAGGVTGTVSVTGGAGCTWTAASNYNWITVTSGSSGSGNGTVVYSVAANTDTSSRTGTVTIAGQTFTVTQAGAGSQTPISDARVFAYAEANYPGLFSGTVTAGQYQQYDYRYYLNNRIYLAIDTTGMVYIMGPTTGGTITPVGTVASFANAIIAWEATQTGTGTAPPPVSTPPLPTGYISQGGLTWMPISSPMVYLYTQATALCGGTINGQTGWRLPSKDELVSLYNSGAMNGQGWTFGFTWSSTPNGSGYHYGVGLDNGYVGWRIDTYNLYVTCVRSNGQSTNVNALPAGYVSQGGLTWMPVKFYKTWADANAYCANTAINGQTGWRLPSKDELVSLYNSGAVNGHGWTLDFTWSSAPYGSGNHYGVGLDGGYVDWDDDTFTDYVTCVR